MEGMRQWEPSQNVDGLDAEMRDVLKGSIGGHEDQNAHGMFDQF